MRQSCVKQVNHCVSRSLSSIDHISVNVTALLGSTEMPIHQLLRMGRGGLIELTAQAEDDVFLMVNDTTVARGQILLTDEAVSIKITEVIRPDKDAKPRDFECVKLAEDPQTQQPDLDAH